MEDNMAEFRILKNKYYDKVLPADKDGFVKIDSSVKDFRKPEYGDTWGIWEYKQNETLTCYNYEVDLDRMQSSAAVLDWIIQVSYKSWVTENDLADLVYALDDILRLQANYCGCGKELKNK
jgi:hypothetical protein